MKGREKLELYDFLAESGQNFNVERNGTIVNHLLGMYNIENGKNYVGFLPNSNVQIGDWLIDAISRRIYVYDTSLAVLEGIPFQVMSFYKTQSDYNAEQIKNSPTSSVYNIGEVHGSIVGNSTAATIINGSSIADLRKQIEIDNSPDKKDLEKVVSLLEMIVDSQIPPSKGIFSKFNDVLKRNSWITGAIASTLMGWMMTQIP